MRKRKRERMQQFTQESPFSMHAHYVPGMDAMVRHDGNGNLSITSKGPQSRRAPVISRIPHQETDLQVGEGFSPIQTNVEYETGPVKEAKAFSIRIWQFSAVFGVFGALISIVGIGNPILTLATLWWYLGLFALCFTIMFVLDNMTSTQGIAYWNMRFAWKYRFEEMRHRHDMEHEMYGIGDNHHEQ